MDVFARIKVLLIMPVLLSAFGCAELLDLYRKHPPPVDADADIDMDVPPDFVEEIHSNCRIVPDPPKQMTNYSKPSSEFDVDFIDTGSDSFWGMAWRYDDSEGNIWFTTVSLDGTIRIDPVRITDTDLSTYPDIAASNEGFGIVWQEKIEIGSIFVYEVQFAYVSSTGEMLVSDVHIESDGVGYAMQPAIVWNEEESVFGCTWQDSKSGVNEIWFLTIDTDGTKLISGAQVSNLPEHSTSPDIEWSGSEYGITWLNNSTGFNSVYFARIGPAGSKNSSDILVHPSTGGASPPAISRDFAGYAISWSDNTSGTPEIYFTRLAWMGSSLLVPTQITSTPGESKNPHMVYQGSGELYHLCWEDNRDEEVGSPEIYVATVNSQGIKTTYEGRATNNTTTSRSCRIATSPTDNAVMWIELASLDMFHIYFALFSCTE